MQPLASRSGAWQRLFNGHLAYSEYLGGSRVGKLVTYPQNSLCQAPNLFSSRLRALASGQRNHPPGPAVKAGADEAVGVRSAGRRAEAPHGPVDVDLDRTLGPQIGGR